MISYPHRSTNADLVSLSFSDNAQVLLCSHLAGCSWQVTPITKNSQQSGGWVYPCLGAPAKCSMLRRK